MYGMMLSECKTGLTRKRSDDFKFYLSNGNGPDNPVPSK
jgi:hypothetical protein